MIVKAGNCFMNRVNVAIWLLFLTFSLTACCLGVSSPDRQFCAEKTGSGSNVHYEVRETETDKLILATNAQYDTPNNVKAGRFSPDSKKFAAAYHYGHAGNYTWIGVWSTETGDFLYSRRIDYWTTDLAGAFDD